MRRLGSCINPGSSSGLLEGQGEDREIPKTLVSQFPVLAQILRGIERAGIGSGEKRFAGGLEKQGANMLAWKKRFLRVASTVPACERKNPVHGSYEKRILGRVTQYDRPTARG